MAIGRISGSVLKSNLTRSGVDLAFETNLLYLDVTNSRVGIGTSEPSTALQVNGTITATTVTPTNLTVGSTTVTTILDEDAMGTNSATALATQQSIKAYVDAQAHSVTATSTTTFTNKTLTSPVLTSPVINTGISGSAILDEDAMGTDSATQLATQQSIKAYVDSRHTSGTVNFLDSATNYMSVSKSSDDAVIQSSISDGDIRLKGNDGGSTITALWLNMSEAGDATFNNDVNVGNDLMVADYIWLEGDDKSTYYGVDSDVRLTHVHNKGLVLKQRETGAGTPIYLTLQTAETSITVGDKIGIIDFQAPGESSGTDAILVAAGIEAVSEGTFAADNNATKLSFKTASSGTATETMSLSSSGDLTIIGNAQFKNINISDNTITTTISNSNLQLNTAGTGKITSNNTDIIIGKSEGTNFTGSLLVGHATTGTLSSAEKNTAVGLTALDALTTGDNNVAVGHGSLTTNTTGYHNTAVGMNASKLLLDGESNVAIGYNSVRTNVSGNRNVGVGSNSLYWNSSGHYNTTMGFDGLKAVNSGNYNIGLGYRSGDNITSGDGNVIIGTVDAASATGDRQLMITGYDGTNTTTWLKGDSSGNLEISGSIIPAIDNTVDLGTSVKRFKDIYSSSGTIYVGTQTIQSTSTGFVFSAPLSTSGGSINLVTDDSTATIITKKSIGTTEKTVESFAISAADSVLYYVVSRDEMNDQVATQKVLMVHNNTTGYASTSGVTKTGAETGQAFDGSVSGGSMRLRATGATISNSISAYKLSLGDNSSAATSGNTAIIINADLDSTVENLDTWAHTSYRGAKYLISVNDEGEDELETIECMVVHNGTDAYITTYNSVKTGSTALITLTADISGGNVRLRGAGSRANLNVKLHRILLSDSETTFTGDNVSIISATTISSTATEIDTFDVNAVHGAFYYVTSTIANGDSSMVELSVATDGTDAYLTTGPTISTEDTDQLSFTATISGDTISIKAASSSGGSTTVNAYRINLKRTAETDVTNTVLVTGTQTISGSKTYSSAVGMAVLGSDPSGETSAAHIYSKDDSASAEVYVRDEAGNVTKLSPHNKQGEWEYFSRNVNTGKVVRVNMEEMVRDIEKLTGKKYIKEE